MKNFWDWLNQELAKVSAKQIADVKFPPNTPEDRVVLGTLPPELRPQFVIYQRLQKELTDIERHGTEAIRHAKNDQVRTATIQSLLADLHVARDKFDAIENLLRVSIRQTLPGGNRYCSLAIRANWKVVSVGDQTCAVLAVLATSQTKAAKPQAPAGVTGH